MRLITKLFVNTNEDIELPDKFEEVDFFDFENIEITSAIKDVKEIDKVYSDFTQSFEVPASKNNNKIFKHYYSTKLLNSFDARIKVKAKIIINGITFKEGYIRLSKCNVKKGKAYSYTLNFFGALSGIEDVIGEDELTSLDYLQKFNHAYNIDTVYSGFIEGLEYDSGSMVQGSKRDVVYPSISAFHKWSYDSSGVSAPEIFEQGVTTNLYSDGTGTYGIDYTQLKPAIKVKHIIDAISERYTSVNFKEDSFVGKPHFTDMYLLLHNTNGLLAPSFGSKQEESKRFNVYTRLDNSDFTLDASQTEIRPLVTWERVILGYRYRVAYDLSLNITVNSPATDIKYTVDFMNGLTKLNSIEFSSSDTITTEIASVNNTDWRDLYFIVRTNGGLVNFDVTLNINRKFQRRYTKNDPWGDLATLSSDYTAIGNSQLFLSEIEILKHLPKMKIIDFLKGMFQKFNLVADVNEFNEIDIKPITEYYNEGIDVDITKYVNTESYDVERPKLFGTIDFSFSEPKTFGLIKHNELTQDTFGDLKFDATVDGKERNLIFDSEKYEVKLPFEKLYYERLSDENDLTDITTFSQGWLVDKDENPVLTQPVLFYNINQSVNTVDYQFGFKGKSPLISTYNRPSNNLEDGSYSLNFNSEIDEFTYVLNENSLFSLYYKDYVQNLFDKQTRNFKVEAKLPLRILTSYSLKDRFIIEGAPFRINTISSNLNNGISQLDLISDFDLSIVEVEDNEAPTTPTNLALESSTTNSLSITWDASTDNIEVTNYNIYVDSVLNKTIGSATNTKISFLMDNTSYDVQVSALDGAGNESTLSSIVVMTTGSITDVTPPTTPTNLRSSIIGSISALIEWDASTDDVAVTQYRVFLDDVLNTTATETFATVTGLSPNTTYEITVSAKDAANNESFKSLPINITTITV